MVHAGGRGLGAIRFKSCPTLKIMFHESLFDTKLVKPKAFCLKFDSLRHQVVKTIAPGFLSKETEEAKAEMDQDPDIIEDRIARTRLMISVTRLRLILSIEMIHFYSPRVKWADDFFLSKWSQHD